jgi:hypothetical protein
MSVRDGHAAVRGGKSSADEPIAVGIEPRVGELILLGMLQDQIVATAGHAGKDRLFRDVNPVARIEHTQPAGLRLDGQRMRELTFGKRQPRQ